jgi:signal transduction histidine kinase
LADPAADEETRKELIGAIDQAVGWMDRMIADLLDISHIEMGRLSLELEKINPAHVFNEAVASHQGKAQEQGVTLACDIPAVLPHVQADADRLLQVLANLLGNAIKFTPRGGDIFIKASVLDGEILVSIADTGPGIPAEQLPRIFAPYWYRRHAGAPRGTGLGLAIVHGIIAAHGGRVWAESLDGAGSCFFFVLPIVQE